MIIVIEEDWWKAILWKMEADGSWNHPPEDRWRGSAVGNEGPIVQSEGVIMAVSNAEWTNYTENKWESTLQRTYRNGSRWNCQVKQTAVIDLKFPQQISQMKTTTTTTPTTTTSKKRRSKVAGSTPLNGVDLTNGRRTLCIINCIWLLVCVGWRG